MDHRCRGSPCAHRSPGATALHGGTRALRQSRILSGDDRQAALLARTLLKSRPRMCWRIYGMTSLLLLSAVICGARPETDARSPAFTKVPELASGFHLLYTQNFAEGREKFADWESQHPDEPFVQVAVAASYLFEELYRQDVLSSDFFLNEKKFLNGIEGNPDPARMKSFQDALDRARKLAKERLAKNARDPEAFFALTLAAGMESNADLVLKKQR